MICANKVDLKDQRVVSTADGLQRANELGVGYVETSAKTGYNVEHAFHTLVYRIPRTGILYRVRVWDRAAIRPQ